MRPPLLRTLLCVLVLSATACVPVTSSAPASPSSTATATPTASPSPRPTPELPVGYAAIAGNGIDVYAAPEITSAETQRALTVAESVAPTLEAEYETTFSYRPTIYLFATESEYESALQTIWHFAPDQAATTAKETEGTAMANVTLAINWSVAKKHNELFVIPHELTHLLIAEYDPGHRRVPAWLNEGLARLSELMLDHMSWRAAEIKYMSASMAATGTQFRLAGMIDANFRSSRDASEIAAAYAEAAQAAEFVRSDVGAGGIPKLLREIQHGASFKVAYLTVTGRTTYDFEDTFPQRAAALASGPDLAASADAPDGSGPFLLLYGFPVSAPFNLTLTGAGKIWTANGTTSAYGTSESLLDTIPNGTYGVTAKSGSAVATISLRIAR